MHIHWKIERWGDRKRGRLRDIIREINRMMIERKCMENRKLPKLDLNITNRCNFRCRHCAFDSGIACMNEMSLGELEKILRETKELGGEKIDITGGEALVREDVEEIVRLGKSLGYRIELVTNGYLLDSEKLKRLRELKVEGIAISLDGSTAERYNFVRRKDKAAFEKVTNTIREVQRSGFYTKINTTVFSSNLEDLSGITELAQNLGADELGFYYFTPVGRGSRNRELVANPFKWLNFIRTELLRYDNGKMKISLELPLIETDRWLPDYGCLAQREQSHLQVLPDGKAYPCAILASYGKPLGDLKECSVKEIWRNDSRWDNYWHGEVFPYFAQWGGCVDLGEHNLNDQSRKDYAYVCPLRKFELEEVL